jgi:hypothetical protein
MTPSRLTTWESIKEFVYGGNARFTLVSCKTGARYTYRVNAKKGDAASDDPTYFINLLRGPNNEADYSYFGVLRKDMALRLTQASRMGRGAPAVIALVWFLDKMAHGRDVLGASELPAMLEVWHEGRCCACGRVLTAPESLARGLGPECAGRRAA